MSQLHSAVSFVGLERLSGSRFELGMLAYPSKDINLIVARISSMKQLGITELSVREVTGRLELFVLGKGVRGIVVLGLMDGLKVAVKLMRTDSAVKSMRKEADMHRVANSINIGPKLIGWTDEMIVMEYVEGVKLGELLLNPQPDMLRTVAANILDQCHTMDANGFDHGQLTDSSDHVIVSQPCKPRIIDFSHSSTTRKPSNVTSFVSYLTRARRHYNDPHLIEHLRTYKQSFSRKNFERVKQTVLTMFE